MKRGRRQPTRREWQQITSRRPVVRRVIRRDTPWKPGHPMEAGEVLPRSDGEAASLSSSNAPSLGRLNTLIETTPCRKGFSGAWNARGNGRMRSRKKRLTWQDLRAMGATPGLMARRVGPDGRARLEQLTAEASGRRKDFVRRLTSAGEETDASEEGT